MCPVRDADEIDVIASCDGSNGPTSIQTYVLDERAIPRELTRARSRAQVPDVDGRPSHEKDVATLREGRRAIRGLVEQRYRRVFARRAPEIEGAEAVDPQD